jgi:hypothetical protein
MKNNSKQKRLMGIGRFMIPLPKAITEKGLYIGVKGAKAKADELSEEERKAHHFIVKKMAVAKEPITAEIIKEELDVPVSRVEEIIDKLEAMKTFVYRSDGKGIDWAYPISLDNTGHNMTAGTGERFFAA